MAFTESPNIVILHAMRIWILFLMVLILNGCGEEEKPPEKPVFNLMQDSFTDLPGWMDDDLHTFTQAFRRSCAIIAKKPADAPMGPLAQAGTYGDWQKICTDFNGTSPEQMRSFITAHFTPWLVRSGDNENGLFTGYYESSLKGSVRNEPPYTIPLYARPDDLVMVDLGEFRQELKGQRIAGRVMNGNLKPYETREKIVAGDWPHNDKVLLWVDDPVDAFFVQIQGSGLVQMKDGSVKRIGYAGQNGHPYYAIGRELIARGELTKDTVSMQSIRAWLEAHPDQADALMNTNKSYVFFKDIEGEGPLGAQGAALTPGRSLAVDRTQISYGVPLWVDLSPPVPEAHRIRRLFIAQDTGGAIIGAVRGDVFWGYGEAAENMAGQMKSEGRYWVLLPQK